MLYQGDCLNLPNDIECDLIYLDPPFFTQRTLYGSQGSFNDTWPSLEAYLEWLQARIKKSVSFLTRYGSIFIHLDRRSVHHIKVWLDKYMGRARFRNEIIWHYTGGGRGKHYFSHKHDTILWYSMDFLRWTFNIDAVRMPYKRTSGYAKSGIKGSNGKTYLPHALGTPVDDVWDIPIINPLSNERLGYPTQKPEPLLERIIAGCSNEGDLIGDFMCGSGTTLAVAKRLNRSFVGCDISSDAIEVCLSRLEYNKEDVRCVN